MKKATKHPEDMSVAELAEATKEFDQPYVFEKARPMTTSERAEERRLRRSHPRVGKGSKKINHLADNKLLKDADALAKRAGKRAKNRPRPAA
jgi:hypothetical protein